MIIVLTGKMGSGKTTALETIKRELGEETCEYIKFAQPLYDLQETIYQELGLPYEPGKLKDRRLLQVLGTDWGREKDENIWCNSWVKKVINSDKPVIITDDCRFLNEALAVEKLGGTIIKIEGPQRGEFISGTAHKSESEIDSIVPHFTIVNNNGLEEFENNIKSVLEKIL